MDPSVCKEVALVGIKDGQYNGIGYFIDTEAPVEGRSAEFPLTEIPDRVKAALLGTASTADAAHPVQEGV